MLNCFRYIKLECKGHGQAPTEQQVLSFVNVCRSFSQKRPNAIIAVHCTHGFNRTGFLIASPMILVEGETHEKITGAVEPCSHPPWHPSDAMPKIRQTNLQKV